MTRFGAHNLNQPATYWGPNGSQTNDFGHPVLSPGVLVNTRWQQKVQQVRRVNGEEVTSTTEVFVDQDLAVGGFICKGSFVGQALPTADAQEIQSWQVTPDLRNLTSERKAFL